MFALVLKVLLAYLLGSVSGSLLLGRLKHVDIRNMGSGNAGGTNAFRTQGVVFALGVVLIDIGKGALAAGVLPGLPIGGVGQDLEMIALSCGFAAVVGHCFPVWHGFRGGKGAATAVGVLVVVEPWLLLPLLATWLVTLGLSGYVGLATVLAGFSLVPAAWWLGESSHLVIFTIALSLFLAFTHRGNIVDMARGTEYRFEKARIVNWFRTRETPGEG